MGTDLAILFVCHGNISRSQMAAAFYEELTGVAADSRGFAVANPGKTLSEPPVASHTLAVMSEVGIDLSHKVRRQLREEELANYDLIIVLTPVAEWPEWLQGEPDVLEWPMADPAKFDVEQLKVTRDEIEQKVKELVLELEA